MPQSSTQTSTRDRILVAALGLFAQSGYSGASMRDIAQAVGVTQGAIYRHFTSKDDLLQAICERMEQNDRDHAEASDVPADDVAVAPGQYEEFTAAGFEAFTLDMFRYWSSDPVALPFRRMITIEQFRTPQMADLYKQYLGQGPLGYVQDCAEALMSRGEWRQGDAALHALQVWGAFGALLHSCDCGEMDVGTATDRLKMLLGCFFV